MTIADLNFWDKSKLVIRLFLKKNHDTSGSRFLEDLKDSSLSNVRVIGRGGLEVSVDDIKNSPQFKTMQAYAKRKIIEDSKEEVSNGRTTNNTTTD